MRLLVDDVFTEHRTPAGHPEQPDRIRWILRELDERGLARHLERDSVVAATHDQLTAVHDHELVNRIHDMAKAGGGAFDAETVVSPRSWDAAVRAAGAAVEMALDAAEGRPAFALVRPPGHHAERRKAMGFCLLNNVAVAAQALLDEGRARRVAIVDFDVHHGNGTQDVFWTRDDVLYVSTHNSPLYPGSGLVGEVGEGDGLGFTVNVPLWPGTGEEAWRGCVEAFVLPVLQQFDADVVLLSAGFDSHWRDPLGLMELSSNAFGWLTEEVKGVTPKVGAVLEGGYDSQGLAEGAASMVGALLGRRIWYEDEPTPRKGEPTDATMPEMRQVLARHWDV